MGRHRQVHIAGWPPLLLEAVAIPLLLIVRVIQRLLGIRSTADLSATDVERYLNDFLDGSGGVWDWDDFTSIHIANLCLDQVRREADAVPLPLTDTGELKLRIPVERVRAM